MESWEPMEILNLTVISLLVTLLVKHFVGKIFRPPKFPTRSQHFVTFDSFLFGLHFCPFSFFSWTKIGAI